MTNTATCSCGQTKAHVVATRTTFDGKRLKLWSDGDLTWSLGYAVKGVGTPRTERSKQQYKEAAQLVMGDVCLYEGHEVGRLFKAALATVRAGGNVAEMRRRFVS